MTEFSFELAFDAPASVGVRDLNHRAGRKAPLNLLKTPVGRKRLNHKKVKKNVMKLLIRPGLTCGCFVSENIA
jgi:hypothetical protein